jgi:uncharacterized protein (DUF1015 family)
MADIRPFPGISYAPGRTPELNRLITQPYDKISAEMKQAYLAENPDSFVRLILPESYEASAALCDRWLEERVLVRADRPALYVYHQEFDAPDGRRTRKGFIAALRVDEFEKGTVLPHERTLSKAKADRLNLLKATEKDYEQIFMLFSDPELKVDRLLEPSGEPDLAATDEFGVVHRVWTVADPEVIAKVRAELADKVLLIADGHHRYETALNYRLAREAEGPVPDDAALRFKTAAFVNVADPGLVIFATHRLLADIGEVDWDAKLRDIGAFFAVEPVEQQAAPRLLAEHADRNAFVLYAGDGRAWLLLLKDLAPVAEAVGAGRSPDYVGLDVTVLHSLLLERFFGITQDNIENHVKYEREADRAMARVDSGDYQACFLMNPTRVEQVQNLSAQGERMPQKSTDFYPKLASGLVFMDIAEGNRLPG